MKRDPYDVLGIPEDADDETVKRAFRALVREHHPDVSPSADSEQRFRELVDAYQRLAVTRRGAARRQDHVDLSEIVSFYAWLASRRGRTQAVEAPLAELEVTPGEAVRGVRRTIELDGADGKPRTVIVEVPAGTWEGDRLTAATEEGVPAFEVVVRVRGRRGSGRIVQALAVIALGYAVGLLVIVLMR